MKTKLWIPIPILCALLLVLTSSTGAQGPAPGETVGPQAALGTAFTYQGYLEEDGKPASGAVDLQFKLFDALTGGVQVGSTIAQEGVAVTAGVFTTQLDFGAGAFAGEARYLEIGVRQNGSGASYTVLSPRQALTAAPYAVYALGSPADAEIDALEQRIVLLECWQGYGECKFVFLTHGRYRGDSLGGLAGGDAICQNEADAAGLPGTYKAWLSTASASPSTRFTRASVSYILPNGTMVAEDWADLTDGSILAPIDRGPDGEPVQTWSYDYNVWTATRPDGTPDDYNPIRDCSEWAGGDWYGMLGYSQATDGHWSFKISLRCWNPLNLYCFQQ